MKTVKFLHSSVVLLIITGILAYFWNDFELGKENKPFLGVIFNICFLLNLAGLIVGAKEERSSKNKKEFLYGMIGNGIMSFLFLVVVIYFILK